MASTNFASGATKRRKKLKGRQAPSKYCVPRHSGFAELQCLQLPNFESLDLCKQIALQSPLRSKQEKTESSPYSFASNSSLDSTPTLIAQGISSSAFLKLLRVRFYGNSELIRFLRLETLKGFMETCFNPRSIIGYHR
jgi:hypothetical protein